MGLKPEHDFHVLFILLRTWSYLPACIFWTSNSAPAAWHTSQLSPNFRSVLDTACDNAEIFMWHAVQADVVAGTGLIGPCVSRTAFLPIGKLASELLTWHMSHFAVSPTPPVGVITGYRTSEKSLWLPPNPTTV